MVQHIERKIGEVYQQLDSFVFLDLFRPAPQVDVSTLHGAVESFRADIDMILEARVPKSEALSAEPAEGTMMRTY